jgi:hypothetical protein
VSTATVMQELPVSLILARLCLAGVSDTGNASFASINDKGNACIAVVIDTGEAPSNFYILPDHLKEQTVKKLK